MQGMFGTPLYGPVYAGIGVPATMTAGVVPEVSLTVIDDTRPKQVPSGSGDVRSAGPGAFARVPELTANGIAREDYIDALLTFNGRSWVVRSYDLMGNPNGEDEGEVHLFLSESDA
jgi:hypothetical protein